MSFSLTGLFNLLDEVHEAKKPEPDGRVLLTIDEGAEILKAICKTKGYPEHIDLTKFLGK